MAEHKYKFNVSMSCGGCSGAVERVLKKLDGTSPLYSRILKVLNTRPNNLSSTGVKDFNVSLDTQTAEITTDDSLSYQQVLEKISKTGKKVNSGEADGVAQSVEVAA